MTKFEIVINYSDESIIAIHFRTDILLRVYGFVSVQEKRPFPSQ